MKRLIGLIAAILAFGSGPANARAAGDFPVFYWQMRHEERHVYRYDLHNFNWREIRKERELRRTAQGRPKLLELHGFRSRYPTVKQREVAGPFMEQATLLVMDPQGRVKRLAPAEVKNGIVRIPEDIKLNGRYLLGGRFSPGKQDVDGDGRAETVYVYAKQLVVHYHADGKMGTCSKVFFNDEENMTLEIGPVVSYTQSRIAGGAQWPHKLYEIKVLYRNRPLPGAAVTVRAEGSGWQSTLVTDDAGRFSIVPFDDRSGNRQFQRFLYIATHHDRDQKAFHVATLPVIVYRNRPEWTSQVLGFTAWTIGGCAGGLLLIFAFSRRRKRLHARALLTFENYRTKDI